MTELTASDEPGLKRALDPLHNVRIPGETLEAWAIERRVFALSHRRRIVAATSGRLIGLTRPLLGGYDVTDIRWQDLEDVKLKVGIIGASLTVRAGKSSDLASQSADANRELHFEGLRKDQAQAVYRICQAQDQSWREKRRIRDLEELRARSGGFQVSSGAPANFGGAAAEQGDLVRRLQEAKQMLDAKLITDAEYEAIKARIVSSS